MRTFMGLMAAVAFEKLVYLLTIVLMARYLSVGDYGQLSFAVYFGFIVAVVAEFAVQTILTKELVERPGEQREQLGVALYARVLPVVLALVVLVAFAALSSADAGQASLLLIVGVAQIATTFGYIANAVFRAKTKYHLESASVVARALLYGLAVGAAVVVGLPVLQVGLAILAASLAAMAFALLLAFRVIAPRLGRPRREQIGAFLRKAAPVAGAILLASLFSGVSLVVLRFFGTDTEVGWYNSSHALIAHLAILPEILMAVLFPAIVRSTQALASEDLGQFDLGGVILIMLVIAVPASLGLAVVAPELLRLVYGDPFVPAAPVLRVLAWTLPFTFVNFAYLMFFSARNSQRWWLLYVVLSILASLGAYLVLGERLGGVGVAAVRVAGEGLLFTVATLHMRRWIAWGRLALGLTRGGLALLGLGGALLLTRGTPLAVQILAGMAAYGAAIVLAGPWPRAMWAGYLVRARERLTVRLGWHLR